MVLCICKGAILYFDISCGFNLVVSICLSGFCVLVKKNFNIFQCEVLQLWKCLLLLPTQTRGKRLKAAVLRGKLDRRSCKKLQIFFFFILLNN